MSATFRLTIKTDAVPYEDDTSAAKAVATILTDLAREVAAGRAALGGNSETLRDPNGYASGWWTWLA